MFLPFFKPMSLIFLSSFPFLFTLHSDFVFDDTEAIIKNKDVFSESWMDCFSNDFWGSSIRSNLSHKSYRPLTIITFRLNYFLNSKGLSSYAFKVTNVICHIICTCLVWITYKNIIKPNVRKKFIDTSYIGAVIFAVHPIHVEAVSGIVGRADILSGITFFLAFLCYAKAVNNKKGSYLFLFISLIMAATSMLFKENGITVLGFCLLYDFLNLKKINKYQKASRVCDITYILRISLTLLSILFLLYGRWVVMDGSKPQFKEIDNPAAFASSFFTKIATHNYIYFLNALLFVWPQWLCYDWSMGCVPLIRSVLDYRIIFLCLMYFIAILFIKALWNKNNRGATKRSIILSIAMTIIPFLPAANIFFPVGFVIAERILYISSAGYCLLIAIGLQKILSRRKQQKLCMAMFTLLIVTYSLRSWDRSRDWQSEYQLFTRGLTVCPLNAKVHYNIAKVTDARDNTEIALESYKESIRLYPDYYQAMNNLANMLKNQKKFNEAEFYLRKALKIKDDFPAAWMNLGIVLGSTKRPNEAESAYKTALRYRRNYPDCFYNLGNLYLDLNRTDEAVENWLQTVNLNQKHVLAWTNLIALLDNTNQFDKALQIIPMALNELPYSATVNFAVANIYGKIERFTEAEKHFLVAIKLFGNNTQAIHYSNLGVLYHRWKKYDSAEVMYKNALKIDPAFTSALRNLNSLLKYKNKKIP